ncbi:MAG: hypothetical protein ACFFE2_12375 [Candidatus Thorarchaeota archaeon]
MNRNKTILVVMLVSAGILVGFLLIPPASNPEQVEFQGEWMVSVGEIYQFEIESWGAYIYGNYDNSEIDQLVGLNGTVINVTITYLPTLDFIINRTTFENDIVEVGKVACIFSNETELPPTWLNVISTSISGCIIPVGDWSILDAYHLTFEQVWEDPLWDETYFSDLLDDNFKFGHFWWGMDDTEIWTGTVSLDNGFPTMLSWSYDHMYGPIELELTLKS